MIHIRSSTRNILELSKFCPVLALFAVGCGDAARPDAQAKVPEASEVIFQIQEPYQIEITGSKDRWHVRYPGADGRAATSGDTLVVRNIHVPQETKIVLVLKSTDYIYTLSLPQFHLKEIAVPDLEFRVEFCPPQAGRFELVGNQLCGAPHAELTGFLIVEPRDRFLGWLQTAGSENAD